MELSFSVVYWDHFYRHGASVDAATYLATDCPLGYFEALSTVFPGRGLKN